MKKEGTLAKLVALYRKIIPDYAHIPLIICGLTDAVAYLLPRILNVNAVNDFSIALDHRIPLIPVSSYVYIAAFAYWVVNYIMIARLGRGILRRLLIADTFGKIICLFCFMLIPSYIVRPPVEEISGVGTWLIKIVYLVDEPNNLLPSIHCFVSWLCCRPLLAKEAKAVPVGYKVFSFVFSLMICLSTLTTRQHVTLDVIAGVGIAEAGWLISKYLPKRRLES